MTVSSIDIGRKGEEKAEQLLVENGWKIIERGNRKTPWDLRAEKNGNILAINIKYGKKTYQIGLVNIKRLLYGCLKGEIPAFLFLIGEGYVLFRLEEGNRIYLDSSQGVIGF